MKKLSDFKLAFFPGMILFVITNVFNESTNTHAAPMFVWFTANALSALTHILLIFLMIKLMKLVIKLFNLNN